MKAEKLVAAAEVADGAGWRGDLCPPGEADGGGLSPGLRKDLDQMWEVLLRNVKELRLRTMDFSDLWEEEEEGGGAAATGVGGRWAGTGPAGSPPPPPPLPLGGGPLNPLPPPPPLPLGGGPLTPLPPPPPLPLGGGPLIPLPPPPPPAPPGSSSRPGLPRQAPPSKTLKLFWNSLRELPLLPRYSRFGPHSIWATLEPVVLDCGRLRHLFERKTGDFPPLKKQSVGRKQELTVLDMKRSNVINIGLTALPAPHIVRAALLGFDECVLEKEAIERLLTMLPTEKELAKIRNTQQASPHLPLGPAEQFLLTLASVNELPARLQLWSFKMEYETMEKDIAVPLFNLKLAMEQLAGNRTFHCILATLLAIGNFLNGVNAKGFELSYLEKVPGVKDTVHKRPLLHHACSIIMQSFPDTTDLYSEITAVTQSAKVDFTQLQTELTQLEHNCKAAWDHLKAIAKRDGSPVFKSKTPAFLHECVQRIIILKAVQRRIRNRFHSFLLYFGYPSSSVRKMTVGKFCKLISDFALEYRTTRALLLQQKERQEREKERLQQEWLIGRVNGGLAEVIGGGRK
ncbi:FH1/FH2 domain-containing protein 3-like [Heterodontus francisci]|uniref:FH1/FH2 domain-containing protein 3-like n=1 Tax=Heterodontus francisci TaxID=7792 RepID=UPI00355B2820